MCSDPFASDVLEFPRVRELLARFLASPLARGFVQGLQPFRQREQMRTALQQVREMVEWLRGGGRLPLAALPDMRGWIADVKSGGRRPGARELADLLRVLRSSNRLRRVLGSISDLACLAELGSRLPDLEDLVAELENSIDERGEVTSAASPRLAELRGEIKRSEAEIQHALRRVLESPGVRKALQSSQVAWRNRRPVLHVKAESRKLVRGIVHDRSQSGQTVFIEPEAVVEPSNRLGALEAAENAEVQRILAELLRVLLGKLDEVGLALEGLAWIDFTAARARLVMELGFVVPELAGAASFRLRAARHPLLLLDVWLGKRSAADVQEEAVPLDLDLGDPSWVLVVTGPNTGGKTVALKTLGLITLMAQAGLPVPAGSGTALPFVDGIFADIGDEQAIAQNLSTFSSHMTRITRLLEQATPESLVLLDELGAGTEPEEGGALGYAILEALHERRVRTMASTHLSRLKDFAYQHAGSENGAMAFDPDSLRPLFRLEIGVPGSSNALHIARAVGVQNRIVDRAAEILGERDRSIDEMIDRIQRTRRAAEAERRVAEITKMRVEGEELEVREKAEELSQKEAWLREEAQHLVDEELRAARDLLADPLKQFLNAPAPYGEVASGMLKLLHGLLSRSTLGRRRRSFLERIRKGHMVYVPHFSRRCRVTKVDRKREILELEVGDLRMNLPFDDVSWLQPLDSK